MVSVPQPRLSRELSPRERQRVRQAAQLVAKSGQITNLAALRKVRRALDSIEAGNPRAML